MKREHRISAGAIVLQKDEILLVRYINRSGKSYLAAPGGAVNTDESTNQAAVREVLEETGIEVKPSKVLIVEDMLSKSHRIIKIWFLCQPIRGKLTKTQDAVEEGIIEAGWYRRNQLNNEIVYPDPLLKHKWDDFYNKNWQTLYLELKKVEF